MSFKIEDYKKFLTEPPRRDYMAIFLGTLSPSMRKALDDACLEYVKEYGAKWKEGFGKIHQVQTSKNIAHGFAEKHFATKQAKL